MKCIAIRFWMIALFTLIPLVACDQEGPPKPVGTTTNKHVEESPARPPKDAAEALTEAVKTPLDKARQAGDTIQGTEDRTRKQVEQAGQ
jgi:hypothetical protein